MSTTTTVNLEKSELMETVEQAGKDNTAIHVDKEWKTLETLETLGSSTSISHPLPSGIFFTFCTIDTINVDT